MLIGRNAQVRRARFGELEVAYREAGAGERLVLVHGLGQDHTMWASLQAELSDYATVAYDLRGHGGTSLGDADGTVAQLGSDLIAILESFGPSVCIGFSLGGVVVLWAAAQRPDLVEGVAALATSSVVGRTAAEAMTERIRLFQSGSEDEIRAAILEDTRSQLGSPDLDPEPVVATRLAAIGDRRGYLNGAKAVVAMRSDPIQRRLTEIGAPVLVVSGERDTWCPRRAAEIMLEELSHASFVELPGAGHLLTDDAPHRLTEVVRHWLEQEVTRG